MYTFNCERDNLPKATEANLAAFTSEYLEKQIAQRLRDARIIERGVVQIGGKPAFLFVAEGVTPGGLRSGLLSAVVSVGGQTHHVTLSCLIENVEKYDEDFAQILASVKFG